MKKGLSLGMAALLSLLLATSARAQNIPCPMPEEMPQSAACEVTMDGAAVPVTGCPPKMSPISMRKAKVDYGP
jgi:hypothetical protein